MYTHFETIAIRAQMERTGEMEHSVPMYLTSSFNFNSAEDMRAAFADETDQNIYSRFSNPNTDELAHKLALLEGAEAGFVTASGMGAIFSSMMAFLKSGDHIIACRSIFGSTHSLLTKYLNRWGISHSYFDANNPKEIEQLIKPNTKMLFVETPSNPGLDVLDLAYLGTIAQKHNLIFNVDNCFATPYLQNPIKYGAHLVTHSATKFLDGQGRVLGGAIVGKKELIHEIYLFCRNTGPSLSAFNAWVLSKSLETLAVRMDRHCDNALHIANALTSNPFVENVKYPFLESHPQHLIAKSQMKKGGGLLTFSLKDGLPQGKRFLDALKMCSLTANLGDSRTIVTHPASTTHAKLSEEERIAVGITPGLVRVSVGLEHQTDILEDIQQALTQSTK